MTPSGARGKQRQLLEELGRADRHLVSTPQCPVDRTDRIREGVQSRNIERGACQARDGQSVQRLDSCACESSRCAPDPRFRPSTALPCIEHRHLGRPLAGDGHSPCGGSADSAESDGSPCRRHYGTRPEQVLVAFRGLGPEPTFDKRSASKRDELSPGDFAPKRKAVVDPVTHAIEENQAVIVQRRKIHAASIIAEASLKVDSHRCRALSYDKRPCGGGDIASRTE